MSSDVHHTTGQVMNAAKDASKVTAEETFEASRDQSHEELVLQTTRQVNTNRVNPIRFSENLDLVLLKLVITVKADIGRARQDLTEV